MVGTKDFTKAIIERLGQKLHRAEYAKGVKLTIQPYKRKKNINKILKGMDVFVDWKGYYSNELANKLQKLNSDIKLSIITNRGVKVRPEGF